MDRTVVLNSVEPAPLSIRQPQGLGLQLQVRLRDLADAPVDPDSYIGVATLTLRPRSSGGMQAYTMQTYDPTNGIISLSIPGEHLHDPLGYSLELWSSQLQELIAAGTVAIRTGALGGGPAMTGGAAGHVVVGPPGPRGSLWFSDPGPPVNVPDALVNDMYLDTTSGDVYQLTDANGWTRR